MQQGYIVTGEGADRQRVPVGSSLVIGRAGHSDLVIRDGAASRRHLEIQQSGGGYVCRDLDSSNGTKINGSRTRSCRLKHGDRILIGETSLRFELAEDSVALPGPESALSGKTMFMQTVLDPLGHEQEPPPPSSSQELLEAAYTLMNALASNFNPCDLVDRILETTTEAIHAQRGAVFFAGSEGELRPCGMCHRIHSIENGEPRPAKADEIEISESIARRVLLDGENVLYQSGWTTDPSEMNESIAALKLTSILCVPIRTQNEILGILYMDTDVADHEYTNDDLLLAAAAGNSAGLALENARNHRALLENQRMEQDIEAAWSIQESFLVSDWPEDDRRFEVYGMTEPAKIVGGDFYDFAYLDEDRVGLLIGDVSGKGVPAALTMAQLLTEFRLSAPGVGSPTELLTRLNEGLVKRSLRGMFCTVVVIGVNLRQGTFLAANAGHHPMMLVSEGGISTVIPASGPPIGVVAGITWEDVRVPVTPGDTMLLYTDGIVEARAAGTIVPGGGEPPTFGVEGIERVVRRSYPASPKSLIDRIIAEVHAFCDPMAPHDDSTMIALRYLGHG